MLPFWQSCISQSGIWSSDNISSNQDWYNAICCRRFDIFIFLSLHLVAYIALAFLILPDLCSIIRTLRPTPRVYHATMNPYLLYKQPHWISLERYLAVIHQFSCYVLSLLLDLKLAHAISMYIILYPYVFHTHKSTCRISQSGHHTEAWTIATTEHVDIFWFDSI